MLTPPPPPMPPVKTPPMVETSRRGRLLDEAKATIDGPRNDAYGKPENSFARIAAFWNDYLDGIGHRPLLPHDVALMMGLLKIARLAAAQGKHPDSWVDLAGYAATGYEALSEQRWPEEEN